jgi:hypothetical protein
MTRLRLASWAALAGLGLVAGCQSPDPCSSGCGLFNGGLMSRLGMRPRCCEGVPVSSGFPVADAGLGGTCPCPSNGGPALPSSDISFPTEGFPGPAFPGANNLPPGATNVPPGTTNVPPGATNVPPAAINGTPGGILPVPTPVPGQPPLAPVPSGNGFAQPSPATPSSRGAPR